MDTLPNLIIFQPIKPDIVMLSLNSSFDIVEVQGFIRRLSLLSGCEVRYSLELIRNTIDFPRHYWDINENWQTMGHLSKERDYGDGKGSIRHLWVKREVNEDPNS